MYLTQVVIENSGPLKWLNISLTYSADGSPKPLILVGGNGSGKTNLLSLIVDALFEAAAVHYDNVLPSRGLGRAWFRVVGGRTITTGAAGSFSLLRFDDAGTVRVYKEKAGVVDASTANVRVPSELAAHLNWPTDGSFKEFNIEDERSRVLFEEQVYAYFPSSRTEIPYWLNREAVSATEFNVAPTFSKRLIKPIYIDQALGSFKQWLIGVLADCRTEITPSHAIGGGWQFTGSPHHAIATSNLLELCNQLLREIFGDPELRFVWLGRKSPDKVAIAKGDRLSVPNLDALSTGQAILLGMFGSLLQYGDLSQSGSGIDLAQIRGICVIDEIDSHIHIDLQYRVLPNVIKMFPNVQFIMSSHSPIFVLGMEKEFGVEGAQVIDMPSGIPVGAETYAEFGSALEALSASHAFTERVVAEASKSTKPIVYVEGETDAPYLRRAAQVLGKAELLEACDIEWIGAKDAKGQGFHTGADALKHTLSVLKANPKLANRKVLLLYDNDSNVPNQDYDRLSVRRLPINEDNQVVRAGIENLLADSLITEEFYQAKTTTKANGDITITKSLRKTALCESVCNAATAGQFAGFLSTLKILEDFVG